MIRGLHLRRVRVMVFVCASLLIFMSGASALNADAGVDQHVSSGTSVTLDGSGSTDADTVTYVWTEGGSVLSNQASFSREFSIGSHAITLTISNGTGTSSDDVIVRVNQPPVADAGDDRVVLPSTYLKLDASGSKDPESGGSIASYRWIEDGVELSTLKSFYKVFGAGNHEVTLVVTDNFGDIDEDTVEIVVNLVPTADAGPDVTVPEGVIISFDASGSSDPDSNTLYYEWKEGGADILNLAQSFDMVLPIGTHNIVLTVTDGHGATATDQVVIEVTAMDQKFPIADAGSDQSVFIGTTVTLDASGSIDPDGEIVKYEWIEDSAVIGESMVFERIFPKGVHNLTLVVTDDAGASGTDHVTITSRSSMILPEANAGEDHEASEGTEVTLDASHSIGENLTYQWILNGTIISETRIFRHIFDPGTHAVGLVVTDEYGSTDASETIVAVTVPVTTVPPVGSEATSTPRPPAMSEVSHASGIWLYLLAAIVLLLVLAGIVFMYRRSAATETNGTTYGYKYKEYTPPHENAESKSSPQTHPKPSSKSTAVTTVAKSDALVVSPDPKTRNVQVLPKVMLNVKVLDLESRTPVPGAAVRIGPTTRKTDVAGGATFELYRSRQHTVSVSGNPHLYEDKTTSVDGTTTDVASSVKSVTATILLSSAVRPDQGQDARLRSVRAAFGNRYREVSGYDRCIPIFYRSVTQRLIDYVRGMTATHFIRGKAEPKEVTDQMISVIESVCTELSEIMVSKRNIDLYARSTAGNANSSGCSASQISYSLLSELIASPSGFVSATGPKVEQVLLVVDREITSRTRDMSVLPITGVWSIAKSLLADQSGGDLEHAIRILIADILIRYAQEMYENPGIVERMKQGIL